MPASPARPACRSRPHGSQQRQDWLFCSERNGVVCEGPVGPNLSRWLLREGRHLFGGTGWRGRAGRKTALAVLRLRQPPASTQSAAMAAPSSGRLPPRPPSSQPASPQKERRRALRLSAQAKPLGSERLRLPPQIRSRRCHWRKQCCFLVFLMRMRRPRQPQRQIGLSKNAIADVLRARSLSSRNRRHIQPQDSWLTLAYSSGIRSFIWRLLVSSRRTSRPKLSGSGPWCRCVQPYAVGGSHRPINCK